MKCAKYLILPLAIACINLAHAGAKQVNLPFNNEPIFSKNHNGLFFNYDMSGKPSKKVVCELSYVYKGWLEYPKEGGIIESGFYGDADRIDILTLTSKESTGEDIYSADDKGIVKVNAFKDEKAPNAAASCHYEADE